VRLEIQLVWTLAFESLLDRLGSGAQKSLDRCWRLSSIRELQTELPAMLPCLELPDRCGSIQTRSCGNSVPSPKRSPASGPCLMHHCFLAALPSPAEPS